MDTKSLIIALSLFSPFLVNAAAVPQSSGYDARMQNVSYNAANTTVIKSKTGFLTSIVFDEGEAVISARAGFPAGWEIDKDDNVVYVNPRPVVQQQENAEGEKEQKIFQPVAKEWDTNLFVRTTKRVYSLDLVMISDEQKNSPAYVVKYSYPAEQAKLRAEEAKKIQTQQEEIKNKKVIANNFESADAPKNWDYYMRVNEKFDSRRIAPDFAYDNGVFTYIGFNSSKVFPAPFMYKDGKEQTLSFNVQTKGKYKIMVVHSVNDKFVLRYGNSVVGVVNQSFGKIITDQINTASPNVERVEVKND
ncbi:TrbG/VirB9 family P-type conjugative transfer protein [Escherichia coli]|uniref:TrbG/VirB9 family P-type conjugative transfer protein n=1 Tax=Enterobacterales TaxID=91347 RepID=UPI000E021673|nr:MULTISPECIES: TrbG/VirB9 family P-type conjugative transfer protein [Enterobacterales]MDN6080453.1 TrbG/VirB9 family P-type conjugative transfer protein [Leuconostoc sp.]STU48892.1 P-type conjugative transfer protein VirB9 [Klebsiella pneumoniae]SWN15770.1 P-type conjugative transfer protein VirB9 [Klebsiella pneumoniae]